MAEWDLNTVTQRIATLITPRVGLAFERKRARLLPILGEEITALYAGN